MFKHLWPGNGTVLIDMTDNEKRNVIFFSGVHKGVGGFPYLRNASRGRIEGRQIHSLNGIDYDHVGFIDINKVYYGLHIGGGHNH